MIIMIKIAICEDEKDDCIRIQNFVETYATQNRIDYCLELFTSGEHFLESRFIPDILFLDIMMNKKDGIQVGDDIRRRKEKIIIIYTTSLSEKMAIAFNQIHSFGYLVKPIEENAFYKMLSDAIMQVQEIKKTDTVTFLSENNTIINLLVTDIYYFEYLDRKIKIAAKDGTYICIKEKIGDIAEKMDKYGFAMSHQSFVVNLYYVDKITLQTLLMRNGDEVSLAQKRASSFRKRLMKIAKESMNNGGCKSTY